MYSFRSTKIAKCFEVKTAKFDNVTVSLSNEIAGRSW